MNDQTLVYRIRNWNQLFETRGSRKHSRPLARISLSTSLEGLVLRRLLSDPQGAAAYGVWVLLLQIAAKTPRRGILADATGIYTAPDLALLTGIPESQVQDALELLSSPRIGLLEQVPLELALQPSADATTPALMPAVTTAQRWDQSAGSVDSSLAAERLATAPITEPPPPIPMAPTPTPPVPTEVILPRTTTTAHTSQRLPERLPGDTFKIPELAEFEKLTQAFSKTERTRQSV